MNEGQGEIRCCRGTVRKRKEGGRCSGWQEKQVEESVDGRKTGSLGDGGSVREMKGKGKDKKIRKLVNSNQ